MNLICWLFGHKWNIPEMNIKGKRVPNDWWLSTMPTLMCLRCDYTLERDEDWDSEDN